MTVPTEEMLRAAFGAPAVEMPEVAAQTVVEANVPADGEPGERRVRLIPASQIPPRPVRWLWALRVALGTLCLLAGREGIGKSTLAYSIVAQITRGELPGVYAGEPRAVIVAATEDSWSHTIVPRLMAAGADLDLVFRADVTVSDGFDSQLVLPADLGELEASVSEVRAALILFDPLVSRLSASLDTHKDAEVRRALEPLVALADRTASAVLGLIHVNKGGGSDALNLVMGSRAFGAVARSVLFAMASPDDEALKLLGQPKNNLGRSDLPTITYGIDGVKVADHEEGEIWTGRVRWMGQSNLSISDALAAAGDSVDTRSAVKDAEEWLGDFLAEMGGCAASKAVKDAAEAAGHSKRTLDRARQNLRIASKPEGFPRVRPTGARRQRGCPMRHEPWHNRQSCQPIACDARAERERPGEAQWCPVVSRRLTSGTTTTRHRRSRASGASVPTPRGDGMTGNGKPAGALRHGRARCRVCVGSPNEQRYTVTEAKAWPTVHPSAHDRVRAGSWGQGSPGESKSERTAVHRDRGQSRPTVHPSAHDRGRAGSWGQGSPGESLGVLSARHGGSVLDPAGITEATPTGATGQ